MHSPRHGMPFNSRIEGLKGGGALTRQSPPSTSARVLSADRLSADRPHPTAASRSRFDRSANMQGRELQLKVNLEGGSSRSLSYFSFNR